MTEAGISVLVVVLTRMYCYGGMIAQNYQKNHNFLIQRYVTKPVRALYSGDKLTDYL